MSGCCGEEFPEGQWKNGLQPELVRKISREFSNAPVSKKRARVDRYAQQLDHGNRHRMGKSNKNGLADDIVCGAHGVP